MHVLITGAGMVGAWTARRLLDAGHRVTLLDRTIPHAYLDGVLGDRPVETIELDLTDHAAVAATLEQARPDAVLHTAALIAARAQRDVVETLQVNVVATSHLAAAAAAVGASRFVAMSSWSVFDERQDGPIVEGSRLMTQFTSYYIAAKLAMEHMLSAQAHATGMPVVALRPAVIYGYGPNMGGGVGSAVIESQMVRAMTGGDVELPRTIISSTELVSVEDVAAFAASALQTPVDAPFTTCTVGSQETTTLDQLAETFRTLFPDVAVTIVDGAGSSVVPPRQEHATDLTETIARLRVEVPLRRDEGFARFLAVLRETDAVGIDA